MVTNLSRGPFSASAGCWWFTIVNVCLAFCC